MKVDPLSDVVVIRRWIREVSDGGIELPPSDDFREDIGDIVFCGRGKISSKGVRLPMEVKVGDRVLFSTNGHLVKYVNGEELIVTRQDSVIGVING